MVRKCKTKRIKSTLYYPQRGGNLRLLQMGKPHIMVALTSKASMSSSLIISNCRYMLRTGPFTCTFLATFTRLSAKCLEDISFAAIIFLFKSNLIGYWSKGKAFVLSALVSSSIPPHSCLYSLSRTARAPQQRC